MAKSKKKDDKPKSIDDIMDSLANEHSKDLDAAFKAHDEYTKEENQEHIYVNILKPGQDRLYGKISSELEKTFESGTDKVHKNKGEVKKAVTAGLRDYFDSVKPSLGKILDDMELSEDEQYEYLTSAYDDHVGADGRNIASIRGLTELAKKKDTTVDKLKLYLSQQQDKYVSGALGKLSSKHSSHHFGKFEPQKIAGYLKPKLEAQGYEIDDKLGYINADVGELLKLRNSLVEKKGHPYLKKKENKKAA